MTKRTSTKKIGFKEVVFTLLMMIVLWAAQEFLGLDLLDDTQMVASDPSGAMQVYFTVPTSPGEDAAYAGGLDETLADAIDRAQTSVDVAAYDFDLERVARALVRARDRGAQVRLVTDSDYEDELGPVLLQSAKIPVVTDDRDPFMHNKFVVIDGQEVWTGSWNLTDNGTYRNNNNVVRVTSEKLAANYTTEFEEMFEEQAFGASSPDPIPNPTIDINGILIETFFESEGNVRERIIELINEAETSIYFMAFVFTDDDIASAIIAQHRAGLDVAGVIEARNIDGSGSDYATMTRAGVELLEDGNPYILHHKVIILDGETVVMGSYNFSASAANKNDENVLIIHSPEIAATYLEEFDRVVQQAKEAHP
jgi:phosphatidylserine/phosphatidylglycerophosphate/cardiolipin synthase-like enzyme